MAKPEIRLKGFEGEWKEKPLLDVVTLYNGLTYSPSDIRDRGTLVLRSSNVQDGEISLLDNVYVKNEVATSPNVKVGDIIVVVRNGSRALIGKHAQIKEIMPNTVIGAFMAGMHTEEPEFMNALLSTSLFDNEVNKNLGATINQITNGTFRSMTFKFPSKEEQQVLGSYFLNLDSMLQSTTKKIASLKQMKQACLVSMFPQAGETTPRVRFKGFEGEWKFVKLGSLCEKITRKASVDTKAPVMMISASSGFINQSEKYSTDNAGQSLAKYTLLYMGEMAYNHGASKIRKYGSCFALDRKEARVPFVYHTFKLLKDDSYFFAYYLNSGIFDSELRKVVSSTARMDGLLNISYETYMNLNVYRPAYEEQQRIASYFRILDKQISLQEQRLEKLKQIKAACLDKMFV